MRQIGLAVAATAQFHNNKCMEKFFGYTKYYTVTEMLLALGLPLFDTMIQKFIPVCLKQS